MTKDEAMKLALEALDSCEFDYDNEERQVRTFDALLVNKAHRALHQALEQPKPYDQTALELCDVCGWKTLIPDDGCLNCGRGKVEQLPVAWLDVFTDKTYSNSEIDEKAKADLTPLYTAPPKREWVGLTDEEIEYIWGITKPDYEDLFDFPRFIEAELREKNGF